MPKAASSLRPHIVQVMTARQGRILTTEEIYEMVAASGVTDFNPMAKRDRNLVNRELSDLEGRTTQGHSRPSPQLIIRISRGRYLYREPRPADGRGPAAGVPGARVGVQKAPGTPAPGRQSAPERAGVDADGVVRGAAGRLPGLWFPPAASSQVRGGPHCGAERRRVARGPESAVAVPILQPGEGNAREPGLPHEDDGTAGAQRGDGGDGGAIRHPDGKGSVASREREREDKVRVLVSRFSGPAY